MPVLYQGGGAGGGAQVGISTGGNTSGDTGLASSQLVLVGSNGITLSGSTNGASMTLTLSGVTQSVQTQVLSAGFSTLGNTSGDTGLVSRQIVLAGGNNVTLSGSTAGSSITITISAPNTAAQLSAGLSNIGNTSGDTGLVNSRIVLAGGANVTLSGSTNGGSMTVTVSAGGGANGSWFANIPEGARAARATQHGTVYFQPLNIRGGMPFNITANTMHFLMSGSMSEATASTNAKSILASIGIYTISASSTLNLLYSASTSFGSAANNNSISSILHGLRFLTLHSSIWSNSASAATTPIFAAGQEYVLARALRSSGESFSLSWIGASVQGGAAVVMSGTMGVGSAVGATYQGIHPFLGSMSVTSAALPNTIHRTDINQSNAPAEPMVMVYLDGRVGVW